MKVLLVAINAKYIHTNLAVYSLMSYASKYKNHMSLVELTINHSEEEILREIYKESADVVAFSCYIWNIAMVKRVAAQLKLVQPKVKIWFGGPEVTYDAKECLAAEDYLEGIMVGEGEQTFLELMQYYVDGDINLRAIDGLCYKESTKSNTNNKGLADKKDQAFDNLSEVAMTRDRMPISLDLIPFPYEDMDRFKNKIIYYESSRGCPYLCSYCLSSVDKRVRFRNVELVKRELGIFLVYQVPQVKFVDRTFNCSKKHAMEIWRFLKENDNGITNFHFELTADILDIEEIEFLATLRPGQVQFEIGVQTTNPDTAKAIHRTMDFEKLSHNVGLLNRGKNIHLHLDLIAGLPLEGYSSFEESFKDVYHLKPDQLQLGFLKILKGSAMEQDTKEYGITYRQVPPYEILFTKELSYDDVIKLKGVCDMVEIYYNSGQFRNSIQYLEHLYPSPMKLYEELSEYYNSTSIQMMAHSRIRRYELLLEFFETIIVNKCDFEEKENVIALFKELLLLDLFFREKLKARPSFVPTIDPRNDLRELYERNRIDKKHIHIEKFEYDVITSARTGQLIHKPTTLLFDYENRDPLDNGATLMEL
ncbi:MAG: hypothetical protein K0R00_1955 [Herbinix sp.]|nr:hypothetical protein [Herbinix sp.]